MRYIIICICPSLLFVVFLIIIPIIVNSGRVSEEERKEEIERKLRQIN